MWLCIFYLPEPRRLVGSAWRSGTKARARQCRVPRLARRCASREVRPERAIVERNLATSTPPRDNSRRESAPLMSPLIDPDQHLAGTRTFYLIGLLGVLGGLGELFVAHGVAPIGSLLLIP